ncbi:DUF4192 family protein [Nocardia terpenica]|uniref:DUF4192 family protein n=1 Tax=Nocardia terpenica TaxID=455432 RepID=UPI003D1621E0
MHRSKEALEDLVRPDTAIADKVRKILSGRATHDSGPTSSKGSSDDLVQQRRAQVSWLLRCIDVVASNSTPTPTAIARCAVALRDEAVRDCILTLADTSKASAAQQLWAYLSRALPDPDRAQASALLAYHAYTMADGPLTLDNGLAYGARYPRHLTSATPVEESNRAQRPGRGRYTVSADDVSAATQPSAVAVPGDLRRRRCPG